ncbi:tetratricopeptide repeat protein [Ulvibacter antarcticus]|uniref:Tfp pilus assembly protein PilF n=1 Tax=Ulvibacter antarcticus TaxID=442714 RepID=A0A3L9YVQ1_9FLAO|nr:tetratricopeptide repeat protein [Ulvibacter antarcticus]RMA64831.1 Tfp pilus assembly protein PilF [Ulvibacter antarcticus]
MDFSPKRRRSLGKKKAQSQQQIFVGREKQIEQFTSNLKLNPNDNSFKNIFSIHGQGGVGKTTLLTYFKELSENHGACSVLLDMEDIQLYPIPSVMAKIASLLEENGFEFKKFNKLYKHYLRKRSELEGDPHRPDSLLDNVASKSLKIGVSVAAEFIPGGGIVKDLLPIDNLAKKTGELADFAWRKFDNKEDVELALYPLKKLTPVWLDELYDCCDEKNIILNLDTYENSNPNLDKWFAELLEEKYGYVPDNITLVFSGRNKLDSITWKDSLGLISYISLLPFTKEETKEFLLKKGVIDEDVIASIISISGCLPVYLALLVDENPDQMAHISHPNEKVVERFLRHITNPEQKKLARLASLPRKLNADIIKRLLTVEDKHIDLLFNWLKDRPFVQNRGGNWIYHPIVRKQMLHYTKGESFETWEQIHTDLADYYTNLAVRIESEEEEKNFADDEWRSLSLESWYHKLCANYKRYLPEFIRFFVLSGMKKVPFEDLTIYGEVLSQAGELTESIEWGDRIKNGIGNYLSSENDMGLDLFTSLINSEYHNDIESKAYCQNALGVVYSKLGKFNEAEAVTLKAIEILPTYTRAYRNLGNLYRLEDKKKKSITYFKRALELEPENIGCLFGYGYAFTHFKQFDDAIIQYNKVLQLKPDLATTLNNLGYAYFAKKDYDVAINNYEKALKIQPDYQLAWNNLAILHVEQKNYEMAIDCFLKLVELDAKNHLFYYNLGWLYYGEKKEFDSALKYLEKAIEIKPDYFEAMNTMGLTYNELKQYDKAIATYNKALLIQKDHHFTINNLGKVYFDLKKDYDKSIALFKQAIDLQPDNHTYWSNLGLAKYIGKLDYKEAIKCFEKALVLKNDNPLDLTNLGSVLVRSGNDIDRGIDCLKKAIEINPDSYLAWYNLGYGYSRKLDFLEGIRCFSKSTELNPDHALGWFSKGISLKNAKKDFSEMINCFEKAVALEPQNAEYLNTYGFNLLIQHKTEEGKTQLLNAWSSKKENVLFEIPMNIGHCYYMQRENEQAIDWYKKAITLCKDEPHFFKGMASDYADLKMKTLGIKETDYNQMIEDLKKG